MIVKSENRLLTVNGKLMQRKVNTLTFQVFGDRFPMQYRTGNPYTFTLSFYEPQSINVSFGDGVTKTYTTVPFGSGVNRVYNIVFNDIAGSYPQHIFMDSNSGDRLISMTLQDLSQLRAIAIVYAAFSGSLPIEIGYAEKLLSLSARTTNFSSFPVSLTNLTKMKDFGLQGAVTDVLPQIPDGLFNNPIEDLTLTSSFDLGDVIASNFFKIDQLKNTLTSVQLQSVNIITLPEEFRQCTNLSTLRLDFNKFIELPKQVESLINLSNLTLGISGYLLTGNTEMLNFANLNKLTSLMIRFSNINLSDLPTKWSGLHSLKTINPGAFRNFIISNARFDEFIDKFYELCTINGSKTANGGAQPYPNRFRNINWGDGTLNFTGAKAAPTGYAQGVSNGTPTNQGQKVYVLQNQYNHTITHA